MLERSQENLNNSFFWLCGFWIWTVKIWPDPEHRESKETVLCPLGWKYRPLGGELQCGGLRPLCEGLLGGSSIEEGIGQPARVP